MGVLADRIEKLILDKLFEEENIVLKRNELAEELDCAPSQISYVLSTRFSNDKGFNVESRRGLGGFVRITRINSNDGKVETSLVPVSVNRTLAHVGPQMRIIRPEERPIVQFEPNVPRNIQEVDRWIGVLLYKNLIGESEAVILHEAFLTMFTMIPHDIVAKSVNEFYRRVMTNLMHK